MNKQKQIKFLTNLKKFIIDNNVYDIDIDPNCDIAISFNNNYQITLDYIDLDNINEALGLLNEK